MSKPVAGQCGKSRITDTHDTPLDSYDESEHLYCWQIMFNGHWCGATHDDRWLKSDLIAKALMKHSVHPKRIVERLPYQTELRYGPIV